LANFVLVPIGVTTGFVGTAVRLGLLVGLPLLVGWPDGSAVADGVAMADRDGVDAAGLGAALLNVGEVIGGGVPTWMRVPDPRTVTPIAVAVMAAAAATRPLSQ
jgi:hypothetical protein